jgi:hypothetical protein
VAGARSHGFAWLCIRRQPAWDGVAACQSLKKSLSGADVMLAGVLEGGVKGAKGSCWQAGPCLLTS